MPNKAVLYPCQNTICIKLGNKTYTLPIAVAVYLIGFYQEGLYKEPNRLGIPVTINGVYKITPTRYGYFMCFDDHTFFISYKQIAELINMYKRLGLPLPNFE